MEPSVARTIWHELEAINAVTYFAPECRTASTDLGLRGFWMGYFAFRAAPMGAVDAAVVEATFGNFHPDRVRRAIPAAWTYATPSAVVEARHRSAATALRRLVPDVDDLASQLVPLLTQAVARGDASGRALFAANRALDTPDDTVAALWHHATTLREHRGDGHVALLTAAGLTGLDSHALFASTEGIEPQLYLESRGWSTHDWDAAIRRLHDRDLLDDDGVPTDAGRALRSDIEARTDALAAESYAAFDAADIQSLLDVSRRCATRIVQSGEIPFPNPMGLPAPD